ncbi:MAG TPA: hypothetical protein VJ911_03670 [Cryomorphaceae bacterium]|nr:hypothetical protein [Cryomorphaceae bacterium]
MAKLKKFKAFADSLFPSEVAYVESNNDFQDPELVSILRSLKTHVTRDPSRVVFDPSIDPRKYSRMIGNFENKLQKIDVDYYYGWISIINHEITTDAISPRQQTRIIKEMEAFEPDWFHMGSFYRLVKHYEGYLLMRYREKDYHTVTEFLEKYREKYNENETTAARIRELSRVIVFGDAQKVATEELNWLREVFETVSISKKTRYSAFLAYLMFHINTRVFEKLPALVQQLEEAIYHGDFYSRRILANFYANKLLVLNYAGKYEEAAFCGFQSIKHHTEDYLYYLNNYSSVLMHLNRFEDAIVNMKASLALYRETRDRNRRLIFISNYSRCLNQVKNYRKSVRLCGQFLDEMDQQIISLRWHYFFRMYFTALFQLDSCEQIIRLERKYRLVDREKKAGFQPYLSIFRLGAGFREVKYTTREFKDQLSRLKSDMANQKSEIQELIDEVGRVV